MTARHPRTERYFVAARNQDEKDQRESDQDPDIIGDLDSKLITDTRTPGGKDRDRVLYSHSFLRLAGVTQISTPDSANPRLHNRLSHSLKVAQVARSLAEHLIARNSAEEQRELISRLGGLDPEVAEAAGLAHDLGHPPFGHAGEIYLNELCESQGIVSLDDGFEGNAQTFRIATRMDASYGDPSSGSAYGLNLTAGTRSALLKYPWHWREPTVPGQKIPDIPGLRLKKYGYYKGTERDEFLKARKWLEGSSILPGEQSLEASVMDTADDITYAIHDLEDFLTVGVINRNEIAHVCSIYIKDREDGTKTRGAGVIRRFEKSLRDRHPDNYNDDHLVAAVRGVVDRKPFPLPSPEWPPATLRVWRSWWIQNALVSTDISETPVGAAGAHLEMRSQTWHAIEFFKYISKVFVIERRDMGLMQVGEERILHSALKYLKAWHKREKDRHNTTSRLPLRLQWYLEWNNQRGEPSDRAFLDYLCSLGDAEVAILVSAMTGELAQPNWVTQRF